MAVAFRIPRQAQSRLKVSPLFVEARSLADSGRSALGSRKTRIAGVVKTGRRVNVFAALDSRTEPVYVKRVDRPVAKNLWEVWLPAHAVGQRKARRYFPGVLPVKPAVRLAHVDDIRAALGVVIRFARKKVRKTETGKGTIKRISAGRIDVRIEIDAPVSQVRAQAELVGSANIAHIVVNGIRRRSEGRVARRSSAKAKPAGDTHAAEMRKIAEGLCAQFRK